MCLHTCLLSYFTVHISRPLASPLCKGRCPADLPRGGDGGVEALCPCPTRSLRPHHRGRPPGRPGGMAEEPHMIWANPCQIRCGFVQWFFSQAQMSSQGFSARGRRSGKDVSPPRPSVSTGAPPFRQGGLGLPRAPAPTAKTERGARRPHPSSASREIGGCHLPRARGRLLAGDSRQPLRRRRNAALGDLIHRKRSPFPVRGEGSWQATAGRPPPFAGEDERPTFV